MLTFLIDEMQVKLSTKENLIRAWTSSIRRHLSNKIHSFSFSVPRWRKMRWLKRLVSYSVINIIIIIITSIQLLLLDWTWWRLIIIWYGVFHIFQILLQVYSLSVPESTSAESDLMLSGLISRWNTSCTSMEAQGVHSADHNPKG